MRHNHPTLTHNFIFKLCSLMVLSLLIILFSSGLAARAQSADQTVEQSTEQPLSSGNAEAGRMIADQLCSSCHSIGMLGDSPFAPAPPFRDVIEKWPPESLAEALAEGIVVGHEAMPEFQFGPKVLSDFLAFLETLKVL